MWTVQDDYHTSGAIKGFEYRGVPVLVSHAGCYPTLVSNDGLSTKDTPYIGVSVEGFSIIKDDTSTAFYNSIGITAYGRWENGRRRSLNVWSHKTDDQRTPDVLIEAADKHLAEAVELLNKLDETYEAAYTKLRPLDALPRTLDREAYITACERFSAEILSDIDCDSYAVQYGVFEYPEYPPEAIINMSLAFKRLQGIREAQKAAEAHRPPTVPPSAPQMNGQLWEPCPHCGKEPVYLPLMLCEECWPQ